MSILMAPRKSEGTITVVDSARLTAYPITSWDVQVIAVLWVLFLVTSVFVVLRVFSRLRILQFYFLEDHLYNVAFTLLLAYNAIITFYSYHGLGSQLPDVLTTADVRLAVVFENVLFDLASAGLVVAKGSLVVFLLRLAPPHHSPLRWRLVIAGPLAALAVVSLGSALAFWARCVAELAGAARLCAPVAPAMRWMQAAAAVSVAVDLWYAAVPWYLLRRLARPPREKILIQAGMSLGFLAAACGVGRALAIYPAVTNAEAKSAAILYLWHGAEMAVTMICIGMPVCRPAYASIRSCLCARAARAQHGQRAAAAAGKDVASLTGTTTAGSAYVIRNFGRGTWEEAVGSADVDSWSQRRILGVGEAVSAATAAAPGGHSGGGGGKKEDETAVLHGGVYQLGSMSRSGITVTKTVDVTQALKGV